jgi:hypothetical protein
MSHVLPAKTHHCLDVEAVLEENACHVLCACVRVCALLRVLVCLCACEGEGQGERARGKGRNCVGEGVCDTSGCAGGTERRTKNKIRSSLLVCVCVCVRVGAFALHLVALTAPHSPFTAQIADQRWYGCEICGHTHARTHARTPQHHASPPSSLPPPTILP